MIWYIYLLPGITYKDEVNKISVGKEGLIKVWQCVEEKLLCEIGPEQRASVMMQWNVSVMLVERN